MKVGVSPKLASVNSCLRFNKYKTLTVLYCLLVAGTILIVKVLTTGSLQFVAKNQRRLQELADGNVERRLVILISQPRSGSSWIGSIFDNIDDAFYVYEPLHPSNYKASKVHLTVQKYQEEILRSLCECKFDDEIVAYGLYDKSRKVTASRTFSGGLLPDVKLLNNACRSSKYRVAKVLQLVHPNLLPIVKYKYKCQIDVVHLVRDPRASIKSRMDTFKRFMSNDLEMEQFTPDLISNASTTICNQIMKRRQLLSRSKAVNKYLTLSYEMFALDPVKEMKNVFSLLGLDWTNNTEDFIKESSSGTDRIGGFGIKKNSAKMAAAWRSTGDLSYVPYVEKACTKVFETFGYKTMYIPK